MTFDNESRAYRADRRARIVVFLIVLSIMGIAGVVVWIGGKI